MKNYIGFVNDHSGSMSMHRNAAIRDYNTNIAAVKDAASREMLDTVVSVVGVGYPRGEDTTRQVVISNPHVLKPVSQWAVDGGTPLYDGIADMINLFKSLPDYKKEDVSFLVMVTTDGDERHSHTYNKASLARLIEEVSRDGRWTFVLRVPKNAEMHKIEGLGIPTDNIQFWDTTSREGLTQSTVQTTQAMDGYFAARSTGVRASSSFYSDASKVDISALTDISKETSLYVVPATDMGIEIRDFILKHRMEYLKGSAFYQLTKTEAKVSHTKLIAIRARNTGKVFSGPEARKMIGLPTDRNARLHPGDHKDYDIFIQSESVNRKLVAGTGVLYWPKIGKPFTEADLAYLQPKVITGVKPVVAAPVALPAVNGRVKPTPSPIPVTPKFPSINGRRVRFFDTRDEARKIGSVQDLKSIPVAIGANIPAGKRWFIYD